MAFYKKETCPHCGKQIDTVLEYCPHCHKDVDFHREDTPRTFPWLDFKRQLPCFLIGLVGLTILATIIGTIALLICGFQTGSVEEAKELYLSTGVQMAVNSLAYVGVFTSLIFVLKPFWKYLLGTFKKYQNVLIGLAIGCSLMIASTVYSSIIGIFYKTSGNVNEQTLQEMIKSFPILSFIVFGFIGPICEEITYRLGLFSFLRRKSRWLSYLVSIVVFAFIHFSFDSLITGGDALINELINIPVYLISAYLLTLAYEKFGFAASVSAHALNNVVSILLTIIALNTPK